MSEFLIYLDLGFDHILDLRGYDHMLFIITLCAVYRLSEWKKLLLLVTAFTIGHSITLALAALDVIRVPTDLVELLIPVTILVTALHNVMTKSNFETAFARSVRFHYGMALFFGFIHGMGFSNYFRALLGSSGSEITLQLFSFNVGIELGQILIVIAFFIIYLVVHRMFPVIHREWNLFISGAGAGVSLILIIETLLDML